MECIGTENLSKYFMIKIKIMAKHILKKKTFLDLILEDLKLTYDKISE